MHPAYPERSAREDRTLFQEDALTRPRGSPPPAREGCTLGGNAEDCGHSGGASDLLCSRFGKSGALDKSALSKEHVYSQLQGVSGTFFLKLAENSKENARKGAKLHL